MKFISILLLTAMVTITMEKYKARYLLVEIDDVLTPRECCENSSVPEFCLGLCSPADAMARQENRITACSKYETIIEKCFQAAEVKNPCKDVTFGECDIKKSKVLSKMSQPSVQLCNAECYDTYNCTTYNYNKQTKECILATNKPLDYRTFCNIRAGPVDKSINYCVEHIKDQVCDSLLEEDCEYNGELLRSYDPGQIISAAFCQEACITKNWAPKCKYWIFHNRERKCILKRDGRKKCNGWGGPKEPSFDHCQNLTMSRNELYFH